MDALKRSSQSAVAGAGAMGRKSLNFARPGKKNKFTGDSGSLSFEDLLRKATAKTLARPDTETNQQVAEAVRDGLANSTLDTQILDNLLYARLTLTNPHKVWLAIELLRTLIDTALGERVSSLQQVMSELNSIAARPMNRYASDLPAQQQVKSGAYSLLRHIAADGKDEPTSPKAGSAYTPSPRGTPTHGKGGEREMSHAEIRDANWPKLRSMLETQMAAITSKLELVQDMVVQISSGGDVKFQKSYLEDLVRDLQAMRSRCEPILARLASYGTDEAAALMSRALEMMDTITNTVQLKDEVLSGKSSGPQLVVTRTAPPTPPESAPGRPANSNNNISSALDGIAELQQALQPSQAAPQAPPAVDPFALPSSSTLESRASNPFKPAPYNPMQGAMMNPQQSSQDPFGTSSFAAPPTHNSFEAPPSHSSLGSAPPSHNSFGSGPTQTPFGAALPQAASQQPAAAAYNPFAPSAHPEPAATPVEQQPAEDPFGSLFAPRPAAAQYSQAGPSQRDAFSQPQAPAYSSTGFGGPQQGAYGAQQGQQPGSLYPQLGGPGPSSSSGQQDVWQQPQQHQQQSRPQQYNPVQGQQQQQPQQPQHAPQFQPPPAQQPQQDTNPFGSPESAFGQLSLGGGGQATAQHSAWGGSAAAQRSAPAVHPREAAGLQEPDPFGDLFNRG